MTHHEGAMSMTTIILFSTSSRQKERKKDYANKVTPVCVNLGKNLHLVQAPGKPPPSN